MIVVFTIFNRWLPKKLWRGNIHPALTPTWIEHRFDMWRQYTWPSIRRQTFDKWQYYVCCAPQAKGITDKCFGRIKDPRLHLSYCYPEKDPRLVRIGKGSRQVVTVRIDSDDMYHPLALEELIAALDHREYYYWKHGHIMNYKSGAVMSYKASGTPPFFAHKYSGEEFAKKAVIKEPPHHTVWRFKPKQLPGRRFVVGINGRNLSTTMNRGGRIASGPEVIQLYSDYGVQR